jgi:hypothetical protein
MEEARDCMGPEQDSQIRTTAAIATVVIVVLLLLTILSSDLINIENEDDGPDNEYPDWLEPPPVILEEDDNWKDKGETLANPLIITNGTTLKVTRSEIRVELIDLVLGNGSRMLLWQAGTGTGATPTPSPGPSIWRGRRNLYCLSTLGGTWERAI